jgi:hypothetical protein
LKRRYHYQMRRWFFVLLILLLPLRGLIGDAMATQMAMPGHHAPAISPMLHEDGASGSAHAHASSVASAAAADCGGNTGALDTGEAMDAAHCETCAMCQTCHTVAVLQPAGLPTVPQISPRSPSAAMHRFASAERALFLKPPIS